MTNDAGYSNLIYEFLLMRFRFQFYKYGDTLPCVDSLCREFCVAPETVKTALRKLRSEGYIDMHNGRATKVLFRQTRQQFHNEVYRYFSERHHASKDLCQTAESIFVPLLAQGIQCIREEDLFYLDQCVQKADSYNVLSFFCYILQKLENPLVMNLFWETSLFLGLLYFDEQVHPKIHDPYICKMSMQEILLCRKEKRFEELPDLLVKIQRDTSERALRHILQHIPPASEQIPFIWRIYYGRPQICYSLSVHIMHDIYMGDYRDMEYLPSYQKLADKYDVSVSTIRRIIKTLNQMGVTESVNGVGTRVYSIPGTGNPPDFNSISVHRNLALFYQAFELLTYWCESAMLSTLYVLSPLERKVLIRQLNINIESDRYEFTLWDLLLCIVTKHPLSGMREIFSKIYGLFIWGYPLKSTGSEARLYECIALSFTREMLKNLTNGNDSQCALLLKEMIVRQFPDFEQYLFRNGIRPEELRIPSNFRLAAVEKND